MEANIPTPKRETDKPFLMPVEDTFSISGRGTVATGRIEMGQLKTLQKSFPPNFWKCRKYVKPLNYSRKARIVNRNY